MRSLILTLIIVSLPLCSVIGQNKSEQDVFVPISKYIQQGDAEKLSAWFAPNLQIDILGTFNVSSKNQVKQVMKDFFEKYTPKSFVVVHRSGKDSLKFAIGTLNAGGTKFRVTLFVKIMEDGNFLQSIRIEKE